MLKNVLATSLRMPSASYSTLSGSASRWSSGKPVSAQNSRARGGGPMETRKNLMPSGRRGSGHTWATRSRASSLRGSARHNLSEDHEQHHNRFGSGAQRDGSMRDRYNILTINVYDPGDKMQRIAVDR